MAYAYKFNFSTTYQYILTYIHQDYISDKMLEIFPDFRNHTITLKSPTDRLSLSLVFAGSDSKNPDAVIMFDGAVLKKITCRTQSQLASIFGSVRTVLMLSALRRKYFDDMQGLAERLAEATGLEMMSLVPYHPILDNMEGFFKQSSDSVVHALPWHAELHCCLYPKSAAVLARKADIDEWKSRTTHDLQFTIGAAFRAYFDITRVENWEDQEQTNYIRYAPALVKISKPLNRPGMLKVTLRSEKLLHRHKSFKRFDSVEKFLRLTVPTMLL